MNGTSFKGPTNTKIVLEFDQSREANQMLVMDSL